MNGMKAEKCLASCYHNFRHIYLNAFDVTIESIRAKFNHADFKCYSNLQDLLLKAVKGKQFDEDFRHVASFYGDDVNTLQLEAQLSLLAPTARAMGFDVDSFNVHHLIKMFQQLEESRISAMSEVLLLCKIFMVMPATNAVSERSFSALKRIKSYLRSTASNNRLNHLMVLHVHKDKLDKLDLVKVANDFLARVNCRRQVFGVFTTNDKVGPQTQ